MGAGYPEGEVSGKVIIFHAGSLSVPFSVMEKNFEKMYPDINIEREAAGSRTCARKIVDLKKPCDIMASADYRVIDNLLIPKYADWNIRFATNRMVLAYTDRSEFAGKITGKNWFTILARKGVVWGHADPNLDPCGYRSLMVLQLAEIYYRQPGLYQKLIRNRPKGNIRPKSVELISLLQTGNMDYAWEYRSVAIQHGLKYLELPLQINLGAPGLDNFYRQARVKISGKRPGESIELRGQSITYGVTLLPRAPDPGAAELFLSYLLSPGGGLKV
ncbi:MAG: tungstate ABC transporter substrate-binding protein WtpA, partial [Candidatus Auribacterota bacterium]|nr:tungstate ABC transporter substrate-binding protein WtpA [Candidatus Auribacterota bacterium]